MILHLSIRFTSLTGRAATLNYTGDIGFVPMAGMELKIPNSGGISLMVRNSDYKFGDTFVSVDAIAPTRATNAEARSLADDITTALASSGMTFVSRT